MLGIIQPHTSKNGNVRWCQRAKHGLHGDNFIRDTSRTGGVVDIGALNYPCLQLIGLRNEAQIRIGSGEDRLAAEGAAVRGDEAD